MRMFLLCGLLLSGDALAADVPAETFPQPPAWSSLDRELDLSPYEHIPYVRYSSDLEDEAIGYWADMVVAVSLGGDVIFVPDFRANVTLPISFSGVEPYTATRHYSGEANSIRKSAIDDLSEAVIDTGSDLHDAKRQLDALNACLQDPACDLLEVSGAMLGLIETSELLTLVRAEVISEMENAQQPIYAASVIADRSTRYIAFDLGGQTLNALAGLELVSTLVETPASGTATRYVFFHRIWDIGLAALTGAQSHICSVASTLNLEPGTMLYSVAALRVDQEETNGVATDALFLARQAELSPLPAHCDSRGN